MKFSREIFLHAVFLRIYLTVILFSTYWCIQKLAQRQESTVVVLHYKVTQELCIRGSAGHENCRSNRTAFKHACTLSGVCTDLCKKLTGLINIYFFTGVTICFEFHLFMGRYLLGSSRIFKMLC